MTEPEADGPGPGGTSAHAELDLLAVRDGLEAAVREAGEAILTVARRGSVRVGSKGHEGPVTDADHAADDVLHERLMSLIPGSQWLSEESEQERPLIPGQPTWVVDPLDGTREFLRGLPEFGVTVGLFVNDVLVLGAVAVPLANEVLSGIVTDERREGRRNGEPMPMLDAEAPVGRVVVSRWDYEHRGIDRHLPFDVYPCGSAAVKLIHSAVGLAAAYLSTGPRSVWDVAGGVAVVEAVGGQFLAIDGSPLPLRPGMPYVPPYIAGVPSTVREIVRLLERPARR